MAEPSEEELKDMIRKLAQTVDLETTGVKKFTKLLSQKYGDIDFAPRAKFIKRTLTEIINEDESDKGEWEEELELEKPKKGKGATGGLAAEKEISDELAAFLGRGKQMARTEIVKDLWVYIRDNSLQNPDNKREIFLDRRMKAVFGCDSFSMFTMNKYVGAHVYPFKPVDLTTNSTAPKKRKTKAEKDEAKKKRKTSGGLSTPYQLSPELARVVGRQILPRPMVTKFLWVYIREHNLQNPKDKREILCDAKLKLVMGGEERVTMFSMNKYISAHLLEKLDSSYYTPSDAEEQGSDKEHFLIKSL